MYNIQEVYLDKGVPCMGILAVTELTIGSSLNRLKGCTQPVPDFRYRSLNTNSDFGQYWHFCGTIIDVTTDGNPYKRGTTNQLRQRRDA